MPATSETVGEPLAAAHSGRPTSSNPNNTKAARLAAREIP